MVSKLKGMPKEGNLMKLTAAITKGAPPCVAEVMASRVFAEAFLSLVVERDLGVKNALQRPAEYYVQTPNVTVNAAECYGVELRLSGVSRDGRTPEQFRMALKDLHGVAKTFLRNALAMSGSEARVQVFVVLTLDGEVETYLGSGVYSSVLEHPAEWVDCLTIEAPKDEAQEEDAPVAP